MKRENVPPGMHVAIPTKDNDTLHSGPYAHRCVVCINTAEVLVLGKAPKASGRRIEVGDVILLRPESQSSADPDRAAVTSMRLNTYTGEVWMHCFALGENRIIQERDVEAIIDIDYYIKGGD